MAFTEIVGHQRPLRVLQRILGSGRIPHAQLFWGPDGVGKEQVARAVAQVLLCRDSAALQRAAGCRTCPSCAKVAAGDHPDLHLVAARKASIGVDEVRTLQEALSYQAFERGRKVAIIRDSFRMTREAANALLKTLEEPSAGVYLILLAHHRNQLLPTLVSRCQALRFDPLSLEEVQQLLLARGEAPDRAAAVAAISEGCPGAVIADEADDILETDAEAAEVVSDWGGYTVAERFGLASRWAAEKDRLSGRLDGLERHLRQRARRAQEVSDGDLDPLEALRGLLRLRELLERNANTQLALDALLLGLLGQEWEEYT